MELSKTTKNLKPE